MKDGEAGGEPPAAMDHGEAEPPPPNPHRMAGSRGAKRAKGIIRPEFRSKVKPCEHYLVGHADYHPGCEVCVRSRGLADRHERHPEHAHDEGEEVDEVPTISFDFCFLCQKEQGRSIPTMVAREHKTINTNAFTCPGQSTQEEEYNDQIVDRCVKFADSLGYKRVAVKSWPCTHHGRKSAGSSNISPRAAQNDVSSHIGASESEASAHDGLR